MLKLKIFVDIFAPSIHIRCFPRISILSLLLRFWNCCDSLVFFSFSFYSFVKTKYVCRYFATSIHIMCFPWVLILSRLLQFLNWSDGLVFLVFFYFIQKLRLNMLVDIFECIPWVAILYLILRFIEKILKMFWRFGNFRFSYYFMSVSL